MYGSMVSSEHYKDAKASVLKGEALYFNKKGTRDSIGHYTDNYPDCSFYYFNDTGKTYLQKDFRMGVLINTIDLIRKDSLNEAERKQKGWIKYLEKTLYILIEQSTYERKARW